MSNSFKSKFKKVIKWFVLLFSILFLFRFIYGYISTEALNNNDYSDNFFSQIENLRKNYASEKMSIKTNDVQTASNMASNQKYEKTASIKNKTSEFEKDEKLVKEKSKAYKAVIQYEQNLGQKGSRQIHLLIGVNPLYFDSLYIELKKIGKLKATEITKVDKTNEYRQLNAKKASIEKTLQSLNELKTKGGEISDFVALNDKILEIEEKAQELGVELGNFDSENEFCTIKLSMFEGETEVKVSLLHRIKVALEWSIEFFIKINVLVLLISLSSFLIVLIIDKFKILTAFRNKINE